MMVVMSPMGDHAPPLLAAMTMTEANSHRSFCTVSIRRSIITIIMVVVMLSRMLDMKNVTNASTHISLRLSDAWILWTMMLKPP